MSGGRATLLKEGPGKRNFEEVLTTPTEKKVQREETERMRRGGGEGQEEV